MHTYSQMKIFKNLIILGLLPLFWTACKITKPVTTLQRNQQAVEEIEQGKQLLRSRDYNNAARIFQQASIRPFNQHTTVAIYYTGLAYYYDGDYDVALQRFQRIVQEFPKSKYVDDARYHTALIYLGYDSSLQRRKGLDQLFALARNSKDKRISQDALHYLQKFFFTDAEDNWVSNYYYQASEENKNVVLEALCYRKIKNGSRAEAAQLYQSFLDSGGKSTLYLEELFEEKVPQINRIEQDIIKIALFMPFNFDDPQMKYSSNIPRNLRPWLEFYEGFSIAVNKYQQQSKKRIYLELFDTKYDNRQKDTSTVYSLLPKLDRLYPDVVVGGVYTLPSQVLSKWTKKRGIPQLVPFSRGLDVSENGQLFMFNPYFEVHGARMGDFAREVLGLKKVAVWSDGTNYSETLANGFIQAFDTLSVDSIRIDTIRAKREIVKMVVDSIYDKGKDRIAAKDEIPEMVKKMQGKGFDGVYIPIRTQTIGGLILGQLNNYDLKVKVMGGHDWWQNFNEVDRELKERYRLLFTASTMYQGDEPGYEEFYQEYLKNFKYPPNSFSVEGYDLGMYILPLLDKYNYEDRIPLSTYIRLQEAVSGIHSTYFFNREQINQHVNIGEITTDGVLKVTPQMMRDKEYWWKSDEEEDDIEEKR